MSRLSAFLSGLTFRTTRPTFEAGQEVEAIVTGRDGDDALVRVGDSLLRVVDCDVEVDADVRIRVTEFDDNDHRGTATLVEVVKPAE